jgi:tetratricopeptide (TPR) repeat protein
VGLSTSPRAALAQVNSSPSAGAAAAGIQKQVEDLAREAQQDIAKGDYASAAQKYERWVSLQPTSANALNNLGIAYHMAGRLPEAVQVLQRALRLDPELLPANLILGIDYTQLNQAERAIPLLEKVLQHDATHRDALLALASAHFALKRFDRAAKVYQDEVKIRPDDADAWYGLGLCFEHLAEDTTRRMAQLGKDSPYTQRLMGEYLTEQDAGFDAEQAFRRAETAGRAQEGLHAALGFTYLRLGEIPQAEQEFSNERRLYPGNPDGELGEAALAMERDDFKTAAQTLCEVYATDEGYFETRLNFFVASLRDRTQSSALERLWPESSPAGCTPALELLRGELTSPESMVQLRAAFEVLSTAPASAPPLSPGNVAAAQAASEAGRYSECVKELRGSLAAASDPTLLLARCACLSGRFSAAFEAARSALGREPQNLAAQYWQAEATRKLAQAAFQRAMTLNPDSWQGHVLLGDIYRQHRKWDLAISHYQAAIRLKPTSPGPLLGLGAVYWETGQNSEAETALRHALAIEPDNPYSNFVLGDIYVRMHRFEDALPQLEKSLARNPDQLAAHADLGKVYASLDRRDEAIAELKLALPTDRFGDIHYQLYALYKKQGRTQLAQEALAESERLRTLELEHHQERTDRAGAAQKQVLSGP